MTPEERVVWQRGYRKQTGNMWTKKYEKTKSGKLMRTYRNMLSRVVGILKSKSHLYGGLTIMSREEFYQWSLDNKDFHTLYDEWVDSNYSKKLSPSIDRINSSLGYTVDNVRWITYSENSRLGARKKLSNG